MVRPLLGSLGALVVAACAGAPSSTSVGPASLAGPPVSASATRDWDNDGSVDPEDRCPRQRGEAPFGCPDLDQDQDDVKASRDRCPGVAGLPPDGCPPPDTDRDGFIDAEDGCAGEPEALNGYQDLDGCPDALPEDLASITGILAGVQFGPDEDVLQRRGWPVLDRAVAVLLRYPDIRIEVCAHTDSRTTPRYSIDLPQRRAAAVKRYLVERGVGEARIETRGAYGDEPIDTNKTAAGRARNRRIEFTILLQ